jgi:polyhydroxyalkanoate synthesis regulator phasin
VKSEAKRFQGFSLKSDEIVDIGDLALEEAKDLVKGEVS